jgi:hypothetical protein
MSNHPVGGLGFRCYAPWSRPRGNNRGGARHGQGRGQFFPAAALPFAAFRPSRESVGGNRAETTKRKGSVFAGYVNRKNGPGCESRKAARKPLSDNGQRRSEGCPYGGPGSTVPFPCACPPGTAQPQVAGYEDGCETDPFSYGLLLIKKRTEKEFRSHGRWGAQKITSRGRPARPGALVELPFAPRKVALSRSERRHGMYLCTGKGDAAGA